MRPSWRSGCGSRARLAAPAAAAGPRAGLELDLHPHEAAFVDVQLYVVVELGLYLAVADIHETVPDHLDLRAHADVVEPLAVHEGHDVGRVESIGSHGKRPVAGEPAHLAAERQREDVPVADGHGIQLAAQPAFDSRIPEGGIARREHAHVHGAVPGVAVVQTSEGPVRGARVAVVLGLDRIVRQVDIDGTRRGRKTRRREQDKDDQTHSAPPVKLRTRHKWTADYPIPRSIATD